MAPPDEREVSREEFTFKDLGVGPHRTGRRFRTKLMSRYIYFSPNGRFDVRFEELVSKAENPGGFLRKKSFLGSIFGVFLVARPFLNQSA